VFPDFCQELLAINPKLCFADSGHVEELGIRDRLCIGHVSKGCISKDDVRGDSLFIGQSFAESSKLFEEKFITFDFSTPRGLGSRARGLPLSGQWNLAPFPQGGPAGIRQGDGWEFSRFLLEKSEANEFSSNGTPFVSAHFTTDSICREGLVAPFEHLIARGSGEHGDHMIESDCETGFFPDTVHATEEFLGMDRTVVSGSG